MITLCMYNVHSAFISNYKSFLLTDHSKLGGVLVYSMYALVVVCVLAPSFGVCRDTVLGHLC